MAGRAGSPTGIVHADMTFTRFKVKVTGLLNFRQLVKLCMLAAMTIAPCGAFWLAFSLQDGCYRNSLTVIVVEFLSDHH